MNTHHCRLNACPLRQGHYLVTSPDFPGAFVRIQAPDEAEALLRAVPWLAGCVVGRYREPGSESVRTQEAPRSGCGAAAVRG